MEKKLTKQELNAMIDNFQQVVDSFALKWKEKNQNNKSWWTLKQRYLIEATKFLVDSLDELINFVEGMIADGKDKKAVVIMITGKLFDYIVVQSFPIWLKPFSGIIKSIVISVIISQMIDFIVSKYNEGIWKKQ